MPFTSNYTMRRALNYIRKQTAGHRRRSESAVVRDGTTGPGCATCDIHVRSTCADSAVRSGAASRRTAHPYTL